MSNKFIDSTGVEFLWNKTKELVKSSANNGSSFKTLDIGDSTEYILTEEEVKYLGIEIIPDNEARIFYIPKFIIKNNETTVLTNSYGKNEMINDAVCPLGVYESIGLDNMGNPQNSNKIFNLYLTRYNDDCILKIKVENFAVNDDSNSKLGYINVYMSGDTYTLTDKDKSNIGISQDLFYSPGMGITRYLSEWKNPFIFQTDEDIILGSALDFNSIESEELKNFLGSSPRYNYYIIQQEYDLRIEREAIQFSSNSDINSIVSEIKRITEFEWAYDNWYQISDNIITLYPFNTDNITTEEFDELCNQIPNMYEGYYVDDNIHIHITYSYIRIYDKINYITLFEYDKKYSTRTGSFTNDSIKQLNIAMEEMA